MFATLIGIIGGCGDGRPRRVPVSGQVFLDGKPLTKGGHVSMIPEHGRAASGVIEPDGRFTMTTYDEGDGCVLGEHGVEVVSSDTSSPVVFVSFIPEKYREVDTSGIKVTITEPTDSLKIELSTKGWRGPQPKFEGGDSDPTKL